MKLFGIYIGCSAVSAVNPLVLVPGIKDATQPVCSPCVLFWETEEADFHKNGN